MSFSKLNFASIIIGILACWNLSFHYSISVIISLLSISILTEHIFKFDCSKILSAENDDSKVVLITGSSSGIGEHLAYEYSKYGCKIFLSAIGREALEKIRETCLKIGAKEVKYVETDLTKIEDCKVTIEDTIEAFGRIDIMHLNHGILEDRMFLDYNELSDLKHFNKVQQCNFQSFVHLTHLALPYLMKNKNKTYIGITCSGGVAGPLPFDGCYVASKNALRAFFSTLRSELKLICNNSDSSTSVTIMYPGAINTQFVNKHKKLQQSSSEPQDLAKAFVEALVQCQNEVQYPRSVQIAFQLATFCPDLLEKIIVYIGYLPKRPDYLERIQLMKNKSVL